jgi:E3 ubiquitin-protein ligase HERC3
MTFALRNLTRLTALAGVSFACAARPPHEPPATRRPSPTPASAPKTAGQTATSGKKPRADEPVTQPRATRLRCEPGDRKGVSISAGHLGTCIVTSAGKVVCWGDQVNTSLCPRNASASSARLHWMIDLQGTAAAQVSVGANATCVVTSQGRVGCWGNNSLGVLGRGTKHDTESDEARRADACFLEVNLGAGLVATSVHVGASHVCTLLAEGNVKCWGTNEWGQLGQGDRNDEWLVLGNDPAEMGDYLPFVDFGPSEHVSQLAAGQSHSCAVLATGELKCWGINATGELGLGDNRNRGGRANEMGANLKSVDLGRQRVKQISLGSQHTCAVVGNGELKCWGANLSGSLGLGIGSVVGDGPREMGALLPDVRLPAGAKVRIVRSGANRTCVVLVDGRTACWGDNRDGALGLGDVRNRGAQKGDVGAGLEFVDLGTNFHVADLAVGWSHVCALSDDGRVKCWGAGERGALGYADLRSRGSRPTDMGDNLPAVDWCSSPLAEPRRTDTP